MEFVLPSNALAMALDLSHLPQAPAHRERYAALADLRVPLGEKLLPCHSAVLAGASSVLAEMTASTERDSWGAGVAAALADLPGEDAAVFLAACYDASAVRALGGRGDAPAAMERFLRLAHKLDAPLVLAACESFLVDDGPSGWTVGRLELFINVAFELRLERLRHRSAAKLLAKMMQSGGASAANVLAEPARTLCKVMADLISRATADITSVSQAGQWAQSATDNFMAAQSESSLLAAIGKHAG